MARIAGVDLPRDKRVEIGLTYIYGIGHTTSSEILMQTGVSPDTRVKAHCRAYGKRIAELAHRLRAQE